jgi:hypothetical protein
MGDRCCLNPKWPWKIFTKAVGASGFNLGNLVDVLPSFIRIY